MKPLPAEQVQQTAQITLAFLESGDAKIPGNFMDGVFSFKSLLRGILAGNLVVCQTNAPANPPGDTPPDDDPPGDAPPAATPPAANGPGKKKKKKTKPKAA